MWVYINKIGPCLEAAVTGNMWRSTMDFFAVASQAENNFTKYLIVAFTPPFISLPCTGKCETTFPHTDGFEQTVCPMTCRRIYTPRGWG